MDNQIVDKFKPGARLLFILCWIGVAAGVAGCVMAARKGAQRLEERDGPVGHLLAETKETLRGHPTPAPAEQP
ncbi:MAG: hypothetical protein V1789_02760 [PVC group bacterium]